MVEDAKGFVNLDEAMAAENADGEETFWKAIKAHPSAVWWSMVVSMCIIMEAYDIALVSNVIAQEAFRKKYGIYVNDSAGYQIRPAWQSSLLQAPVCGSFIGVLIGGSMVARWGFKKTLLALLFWMNLCIFIVFFSVDLPMLLAGQVLSGISWGAFSIIGPAFASELAPLALRSFLTVYIQLCWCAGQFICSGVNYVYRNNTTEWAYRIPFVVQFIWPAPLFFILLFSPESPWFLVRNGRYSEAEKVIDRIKPPGTKTTAETLSYMIRTCRIEAEQNSGVSWKDCFKGTDRRRTMIVTFIHVAANFSGVLLTNLGTYFFTVAGLDADKAYGLGLANTGFQFVGVLCSWVLIRYFGHRTIWIWGTAWNGLVLTLIGILACIPQTNTTRYAQGGLLILMTFSSGATVLPMLWAIVAETASLRLRTMSIGISRDIYYIFACTIGILNSYMLNPAAFNLIGKSAFLWAGSCVVIVVVSYYHLPECKHRSWRELDILFNRGTDARKFSSTKIELAEEK
ncbi:general substrate transporter [Meredithblackwellia eburnea MCA 4105]